MKGFRTSRLSSIPKEQLIHVMRFMCSIKDYNKNPKVVNLLKIVNNDESAWLLNGPNWDDDTMYSYYYRGIRSASIELISKAANFGFAPALRALGILTDDKSLLQRAIDAGYRPACYDMMSRYGDLFVSVDPEDVSTMIYMYNKTANYKLLLRANFLSGAFHTIQETACACRRFNQHIANASDIQVMYDTGCEMDGYDELWNNNRNTNIDQCIQLYLYIVHKARLAALQTLAIRGICRDVLRIIAKKVYASKCDASGWYSRSHKKIKL
jgi:hypothetical protein